MDLSGFLYGGETDVVPLAGNETGACAMGLENSSWYIVEIFPKEANEMMVAKANRIGIESAAALLTILLILLLLTYAILDRSRLETQKALVSMTANAFEEDKQNAFVAGMDAHLARPIDMVRMVETLTEILGDRP